MPNGSWCRVLALTVLLATPCTAARPTAALSPTPSEPAMLSPTPSATATPTTSPPTTATANPVQPECWPVQQPPRFAPSTQSNRNLAIVWLRGSNDKLVRDISDIDHPSTVATLDIPSHDVRFLSATDVSWIWSDQRNNLFRTAFATRTNTLVAACPPFLFDWSPDGTTAVYRSSSALRQVNSGNDRVFGDLPPFPMSGCESQTCADNWEFRLLYSPDGTLISLVENVAVSRLRIWTKDGMLVKSIDSKSAVTMSVWSGSGLYFRNAGGVQVWRNGTLSEVLPGVLWIAPKASPGGGKIVYAIRDGSGLPHVGLLDTASGTARELASSRNAPSFLSSRYLWYRGERLCTSSDSCATGLTIATGKTYIYDLVSGTESESIITEVADVWPHPA